MLVGKPFSLKQLTPLIFYAKNIVHINIIVHIIFAVILARHFQ